MVKLAGVNAPPELPSKFLGKLDPQLKEAYLHLPLALASRIAALVRQALQQGIHPDRLLEFAFQRAKAEHLVQDSSISREHTRCAKLELAARIHGSETGYRDDAKARRLYRRGRKARQALQTSTEALLKKMLVHQRVVQRLRSDLPVHTQRLFSDVILSDLLKKLQEMVMGTALDEEDLSAKASHRPELSDIDQTYIWWHQRLPRYRGKLDEMHRLAFAWRMSSSESGKLFRRNVYRVCKRAADSRRFGTLLESLVSRETTPF